MRKSKYQDCAVLTTFPRGASRGKTESELVSSKNEPNRSRRGRDRISRADPIQGLIFTQVCAAPIACGKADGHLVYDRLQALAAAEAGDGRPAPLVRCATKCSSNCRAGKATVCEEINVSRPLLFEAGCGLGDGQLSGRFSHRSP